MPLPGKFPGDAHAQHCSETACSCSTFTQYLIFGHPRSSSNFTERFKSINRHILLEFKTAAAPEAELLHVDATQHAPAHTARGGARGGQTTLAVR